jgi:hypothetical protein
VQWGRSTVHQVAAKAACDSGEDVLLLPVWRNLTDADLIEWGTGGDRHLEGPPVMVAGDLQCLQTRK